MNFRNLVSASALLLVNVALAASAADNFDTTTESVGRTSDGLETPVNQRVTPTGKLIELPGVRPNALALSPDRELLVTSGLKSELLILSPASGEILQHVPFPTDQRVEQEPVSPLILAANKAAKLSFTGLVFSPDGTRIYVADVNGVIRVFGVAKDKKVAPLFSFALPTADAPTRKNEIPAGLAVSADGRRIYV